MRSWPSKGACVPCVGVRRPGRDASSADRAQTAHRDPSHASRRRRRPRQDLRIEVLIVDVIESRKIVRSDAYVKAACASEPHCSAIDGPMSIEGPGRTTLTG